MIGLRPMPGRERTGLNDEAALGLSTVFHQDRAQPCKGFHVIAGGF